MDDKVSRTEADGVITLTWTRERKRNAIDFEMLDELERAVTDLAERIDLRVLVITGEGEYLTSGMDITVLDPNPGMGPDGVLRGSMTRFEYRDRAHHDFYDVMERVEKPIILAAQGHCFGVGVEMGVSCDFRLASDAATFSLPEIKNLSVLPASGGISRLTRLVGPHWARWMVMAGETLDAEQAREIGLVHAVYPAAEFEERVHDFAVRLAQMPSEALGLAKLAIDAAADTDRRTARDIDRLAQTLLFHSKDWQDRIEAFTNRPSKKAEPEG